MPFLPQPPAPLPIAWQQMRAVWHLKWHCYTLWPLSFCTLCIWNLSCLSVAGEGMPVTVSHGAARTVHSYTIPSSSGTSYLPTRSTVEASLPKVADNPVTGVHEMRKKPVAQHWVQLRTWPACGKGD